MPDPRPDPESTLTPAEDDAVRALLASARHTAPTPPDVVARLESSLESLGEERRIARPETRTPVVTLASRRRRTGAAVLLAAAAVVVVGVGVGQVLPSSTPQDSAGGSAETATSAEDPSMGGSDRAFGAAPSAGAAQKQGDTSGRSAAENAPAPSSEALSDPTALSGESALGPQVRALRRNPPAATLSTDPTCRLPGVGAGRVLAVTYNGIPGALVLRVPVGATQRVDVFLCGQRGAFRSIEIPAPDAD